MDGKILFPSNSKKGAFNLKRGKELGRDQQEESLHLPEDLDLNQKNGGKVILQEEKSVHHPEDLVLEILARLSLIYFLKLSHVARRWRGLLFDHSFIQTHYLRSPSTRGFIVNRYPLFLNFTSNHQNSRRDEFRPHFFSYEGVPILASMNGHDFLCSKMTNAACSRGPFVCESQREAGPYWICNPITGDKFKLPKPSDIERGSISATLAVEHSQPFDYKVMLITRHSGGLDHLDYKCMTVHSRSGS
ncbi:hypothetical protein AMTR_s00039p00133610 [Amborella trichopoda]|uniref:F-box domain-containing protein n=1 Tax=Amborella trichopoda TaxID=13333 RepID=U5D0N2_AMBTC|nr:hypothetical protein AMTR_s00039p00133610 [Amborella trichopoda]